MTWTPVAVTPGAGLDPSWHVGLTMATHRGLDWGTQIIFSYGPLGFLANPLTMYGGLAAAAAVYTVAVLTGFAAVVLWAFRATGRPRALGVFVALVASTLASVDVVVPLVFVVAAVAICAERPSKRLLAAVGYGGGFVAGLECLVKLNEGIVILAITAIAVIALPVERRAAAKRFAAALVATFAFFWLLTGQGVGNLDDYVRSSAEIVGGYSAAMSHEMAPGWTIPAGLALIATALTACALATSRARLAARLALGAIAAIVSFAAWKEGFVRHEVNGHLYTFFSWMLAPWIAVMLVGRARWPAVGVAGFAATAGLYLGASHIRLADEVDPVGNARGAVAEVRDLIDPVKRGEDRLAARFATDLAYGVDAKTLRLIGQRPVDVYPWETSLAWSLELNWRPEPVFQSYSAYTPYLDQRNADALVSPTGPELILRHLANPLGTEDPANAGIETRYQPYDAPAATLAMLCNFRAVRTTSRYQLLERSGDRCGTSRVIASTTARYGDAVRVPAPPKPNDLVIARVTGLGGSFVERLATLLYRPAQRYVTFDAGGPRRLVTATAADGLLVSAPRRLDFPTPFAMAPDTRTLTFGKDAAFASPAGELHIEFDAVPVAPASGAPG